MIFICLTPNPKGEHLKIIELGSPLWRFGGQWTFRSMFSFFKLNLRFAQQRGNKMYPQPERKNRLFHINIYFKSHSSQLLRPFAG